MDGLQLTHVWVDAGDEGVLQPQERGHFLLGRPHIPMPSEAPVLPVALFHNATFTPASQDLHIIKHTTKTCMCLKSLFFVDMHQFDWFLIPCCVQDPRVLLYYYHCSVDFFEFMLVWTAMLCLHHSWCNSLSFERFSVFRGDSGECK